MEHLAPGLQGMHLYCGARRIALLVYVRLGGLSHMKQIRYAYAPMLSSQVTVLDQETRQA